MTGYEPLATALDQLQVGVLVLDAEFNIAYLNLTQLAHFKRLGVDLPLAALLGQPITISYPLFAPDEWDGILTRLSRQGERLSWSRLPCPRAHPSSYVAVELVPLQSGHGSMAGALCLTHDVTKQVGLERELLEKEHLALVGQMGVALVHEIFNPLAAILGTTEALLFLPTLTPEVRRRVEALKTHAIRIAEIIRRLRELEDLQIAEYIQAGAPAATVEPRSS